MGEGGSYLWAPVLIQMYVFQSLVLVDCLCSSSAASNCTVLLFRLHSKKIDKQQQAFFPNETAGC